MSQQARRYRNRGLVLTRKLGEVVDIGEHITVEIAQSNGPVRLRIAAPDEVRILRRELQDRPAA